MPPPVATAVYFVVSEALTNVAKYAGAQSAVVTIGRENGRVTVTVADDGVGGADMQRGSVLRGLLDRVAALDGRLELESPPGGDARRGRFPRGGPVSGQDGIRYELTRVRLADGLETTVYLVRHPRTTTSVRVVSFREPRRLDGWCAEHGHPEAIVAGFFVRDPYRPLGETWSAGQPLDHEPTHRRGGNGEPACTSMGSSGSLRATTCRSRRPETW